jgi:HrpA-like RNA helicase
LDQNQKLTPLGRQMAGFPLEPALAKILIMSKSFQCTQEAIAIISLLSVETLFHTPSDKREEALDARRAFISTDGDMLTFLNVFKAFLSTGKDKQWCHDHFINYRALKNVMVC